MLKYKNYIYMYRLLDQLYVTWMNKAQAALVFISALRPPFC